MKAVFLWAAILLGDQPREPSGGTIIGFIIGDSGTSAQKGAFVLDAMMSVMAIFQQLCRWPEFHDDSVPPQYLQQLYPVRLNAWVVFF